MKILNTHPLGTIDHLVKPDEFQRTTMQSNALTVCTDFKVVAPLIVVAHAKLAEAEQLMRNAHVKLKLVVGNNNELVGTIAYRDLSGPEIIKRVAAGEARDSLSVADVMTPRSELKAIDLAELEHATVGDLVNTLQKSGEQHCLIIDQQQQCVRGLISVSDIARQLHVPLVIEKMPTFVDLFEALTAAAA